MSLHMQLQYSLPACQNAAGSTLVFASGAAVLAVATAPQGRRAAARSAIRQATEQAMQKTLAGGDGNDGSAIGIGSGTDGARAGIDGICGAQTADGADGANHAAVVICPPGRAPHFAPPHQGIGLSFSHAPGLSVAAVHLHSRIGIDLVRVEPVPDCIQIAHDYLGALAARHLSRISPAERTAAFAGAWAAHEARLKCMGWPLQEWSAALADALHATQAIRVATAPEWCAVVAVESTVAMQGNQAGLQPGAWQRAERIGLTAKRISAFI